MGSNQLKHVIN